MFTTHHTIPRAHLPAFENIADTFGCALDIHAPEDVPENELTLTWVIDDSEKNWLETAIATTNQDLNLPALTLNWTEVPQNIDWQAKVAANFPPLTMGSFFIARNNEDAPEGCIKLTIPANQAFGSGEHATTAGCLALFEHLYMQEEKDAPAKILDLGAGSGLLAMAAAKIYPGSLNIATDICATSVAICAENCADNAVPHIICATADGFDCPKIKAEQPFNLIFANILMNPLLAMAEYLVTNLADGGIAILSGFTPEQFEIISNTYTGLGLTPLTHIQQTQDTSASQNIPAEWIAAAFIK